MILSSHIIAASAVAAPLLSRPLDFANMAFIFFASFLSHFFLDALPHWDYKMLSFTKENGERRFIFKKYFSTKDFLKNLLDGVIGLAGAILIIGFPKDFSEFILFGLIVFGSILPDALEATYAINKYRFLEPLHKFHLTIHGKRVFQNRPFLGTFSQVLIIALIVFIFSKF
ncbi:MAG: hypothetical protein AAB940_00805 [Patescibacteria group bacterium]